MKKSALKKRIQYVNRINAELTDEKLRFHNALLNMDDLLNKALSYEGEEEPHTERKLEDLIKLFNDEVDASTRLRTEVARLNIDLAIKEEEAKVAYKLGQESQIRAIRDILKDSESIQSIAAMIEDMEGRYPELTIAKQTVRQVVYKLIHNMKA